MIRAGNQVPNFEAMVEAAIRLLNARVSGWVRRINVEKLDQSASGYCVLCQATGKRNFGGAMIAAGISYEQAKALAFLLVCHGSSAPAERVFDLLNQLWKRKISEQLAEEQKK